MSANDPDRTVPRASEQAADDTGTRAADESSADPNRTAAHAPASTDQPGGTVVRTPADVSRLEEGAQASAEEGVPGYVLLGELGRGGMGVVHKARHVKLNRVVALKMMLGGERAGRGELIRFLAEAEAVAAVKHENVVQVYDYGESDGRPFMALEYCAGGTLGTLLPKDRDAAKKSREMAVLVAQVARGVAAAHAQGIVHRDLKPGNVFLDDAGVPKVADFGLAKRGEGSDVTREGVGMGTPAYMAPEQARDAKFVGPQADVWALGVILYEALTGTRPFTGTVQEILAKAQNADPLTPRKVVPAVPRDLELICLTCLAKQPHERYATAKELADDLDRYARGEPISVRPAGPLERGYKWVKRNKVVSGAAAAVFLALAVGAGVSFAFGVEAREQAADAKQKKKDADDAAEGKRLEAERAEREKNDAIAARKGLQRELAKALRGPLAGVRFGNNTLGQQEVEALWNLAALRGTPVPLIFLEEAISTPVTSKQLEGRAAFALHAAVGLDPTARAQSTQLLTDRLTAPGLSGRHRTSLALVCSFWGDADPAASRLALDALSENLANTTSDYEIEELAAQAVPLLSRLPPDQAAVEGRKFLQRIVAVWGQPAILIHRALGRGLVVLLPFLPTDEAARVCADAIVKTVDAYALGHLVKGLAQTCQRLPRERTATVCAPVLRYLIERLEVARNDNFGTEGELPKLFAALASILPPAEAARHFAEAFGAIRKQPGRSRIVGIGKLTAQFAEVVRHTASEQLSQCDPFLALFLEEIETFSTSPELLIDGLSPVLSSLPPTRAAAICAHVAATFSISTPGSPIRYNAMSAAKSVEVLAPYLPPEAAAELCGQIAERLNEEIAKPDGVYLLSVLAPRLAAMAKFLPAAKARRVCDLAAQRLLAMFAKSENIGRLELISVALATLMPLLPRDEATAICDALSRRWLELLPKCKDLSAFSSFGKSLSALLEFLPPEQAVQRFTEALDAASRLFKVRWSLGGLTDGVARFASRLPPAQAEVVCRIAADRIRDAFEEDGGDSDLSTLIESLTQVAQYLPPEDALRHLLGLGSDTSERKMRRRLTADYYRQFTAGVSDALDVQNQQAALAVGSFATPHNALAALSLVRPQPRPLPPQVLVEFLKHPFCIGETRRAVLDALEFTYSRPFKDQWEFVKFVQDNNIQDNGKPLDLLTPPKRPRAQP